MKKMIHVGNDCSEQKLPNARAVIPHSPDDKSATSAGHASYQYLSIQRPSAGTAHK